MIFTPAKIFQIKKIHQKPPFGGRFFLLLILLLIISFPVESQLLTLQGHGSEVWSVAYSPDGKTLASDSYKTIKLWDLGFLPALYLMK